MVEIIAHRGASRESLENTLESFALALEQGADGLELDVHATRDGTVVVHHDAVICTVDGKRIPIAEVGADAVAAARLPGGRAVPTLDAVFDLVAAAARPATVYVEVKGAGIEEALATVLVRHPGLHAPVHAFDHRIPVAVREAVQSRTGKDAPGRSIGLLSTSYPLDVGALLRPARADALWQHVGVIDAALVAAARAEGARVIAWTENDPAHARALVAMGVDALCTDTPGALRAALS